MTVYSTSKPNSIQEHIITNQARTTDLPESEILSLIAAAPLNIDPQATITAKHHGSSNKTLYRIQTTPTTACWLKVYPEQKKFRQELNTYMLLKKHNIPSTPRLIWSTDKPYHSLLITDCPGTPTDKFLGKTDHLEHIFTASGTFLKLLHSIAPERPDSMTPLTAIHKRFDYIKKNNTDTTTEWIDSIRLFESLLSELETLSPSLSRGLCHRDYTPENWLYSAEHGLHVFDFEHSLFDITILDITRLNAHYFIDNPAMQSAFFQGYSPEKTPTDEYIRTLNILTLFYGLQTLAWGKKYNDKDFIHSGQRAITRTTSVL